MATIEYPQLVIFNEKHSNPTYIANSRLEKQRIAVEVIRERAALGYYYATDVEKLEDDRSAAIEALIASCDFTASAPRTVEELNSVTGTHEERAAKYLGVDPEAFAAYPNSIKEVPLKRLAKFEKSLPSIIRDFGYQIAEAKGVLRIVQGEKADTLNIKVGERVHNLALWILESRQDYEYESFEIVYPHHAPTEEAIEAGRVS